MRGRKGRAQSGSLPFAPWLRWGRPTTCAESRGGRGAVRCFDRTRRVRTTMVAVRPRGPRPSRWRRRGRGWRCGGISTAWPWLRRRRDGRGERSGYRGWSPTRAGVRLPPHRRSGSRRKNAAGTGYSRFSYCIQRRRMAGGLGKLVGFVVIRMWERQVGGGEVV